MALYLRLPVIHPIFRKRERSTAYWSFLPNSKQSVHEWRTKTVAEYRAACHARFCGIQHHASTLTTSRLPLESLREMRPTDDNSHLRIPGTSRPVSFPPRNHHFEGRKSALTNATITNDKAPAQASTAMDSLTFVKVRLRRWACLESSISMRSETNLQISRVILNLLSNWMH